MVLTTFLVSLWGVQISDIRRLIVDFVYFVAKNCLDN